jgi:hypothetical protein
LFKIGFFFLLITLEQGDIKESVGDWREVWLEGKGELIKQNTLERKGGRRRRRYLMVLWEGGVCRGSIM